VILLFKNQTLTLLSSVLLIFREYKCNIPAVLKLLRADKNPKSEVIIALDLGFLVLRYSLFR
ncbi:hypothetical protein, partial [Streptococcus orisratti]|uniref:hypothetical protein n=1 Tax=Streptococcus orisratti TaxID=114652 RepID=UPI003CFEFE24